MSIADSIKSDHNEIRGLIAKLRNTSTKDAEERRIAIADLRRKVFAHFRAEEGTVLQEMYKVAELRPLTMDLLEENRAIRMLFDGVKATMCSEEIWLPRLTPVSELLALHMDKEENVAMPAAPKYFTDAQLDAMGRVFDSIATKESGQMTILARRK
jgi:hypothetical protein